MMCYSLERAKQKHKAKRLAIYGNSLGGGEGSPPPEERPIMPVMHPGGYIVISRSAKSQLGSNQQLIERVESASSLMMQGLSIGKAAAVAAGGSTIQPGMSSVLGLP